VLLLVLDAPWCGDAGQTGPAVLPTEGLPSLPRVYEAIRKLRADWIRWLGDAGFVGARSVPFEHSELEPGSHEVFVATTPDA
jgi:hypothetical protein